MPKRKRSGVSVVTAKQVAYCLKHLPDGTALRRSPLTALPAVTRLAAEQYRGSYWGHAHALRDVIVDACSRLESGVGGDRNVARVVTFLKLYTNETSISEIARTLAVNRTTIYRFILPAACALLAEEMEQGSIGAGARVAGDAR